MRYAGRNLFANGNQNELVLDYRDCFIGTFGQWRTRRHVTLSVGIKKEMKTASELWDLLHEVAPFVPVANVELQQKVQNALDEGAEFSEDVMNADELRAIAKAASFIRFTSSNWDFMTQSARREAESIAVALAEIEVKFGWPDRPFAKTEEGKSVYIAKDGSFVMG